MEPRIPRGHFLVAVFFRVKHYGLTKGGTTSSATIPVSFSTGVFSIFTDGKQTTEGGWRQPEVPPLPNVWFATLARVRRGKTAVPLQGV